MGDAGRWIGVAAGGVGLLAAALGLGLLWVRRRVAQVATMGEAALLASFASTGFPRRGETVQVLRLDRGKPVVTYARHNPVMGWHRSDDRLPITGAVLGWRPDPFASNQGPAVEDLSDEEIARALKAMTPEA